MRAPADRYRRVAAAFGDRVAGVDAASWAADSPCAGWTARDVVRHLVDWVPALLASGAGVDVEQGPSVDDDPVGAWAALDRSLQALLDDPASAARAFDHPQAGSHRLDEAIMSFVLGDVLIHTWDLARATGQDESLDPDEVAAMVSGIAPIAEALVQSGHYAAAVELEAGGPADDQTRLLALLGRRP